MTLRQVIEIPNNHQLVISLPEDFKTKKMVLVTIDEIPESNLNPGKFSDKMDEMLAASKDPLFLSDMVEVNNDFDHLSDENL